MESEDKFLETSNTKFKNKDLYFKFRNEFFKSNTAFFEQFIKNLDIGILVEDFYLDIYKIIDEKKWVLYKIKYGI